MKSARHFASLVSNDWKFARRIFPIIGTLLLAAGAAAADKPNDDPQSRIAKAEAGPATIDVSSYPAPMQAKYKIFAEKCAQCHKLSRPINSDFVLPGEWERYIKRMMYKPDASFDKAEAKQIFEFLAYDSSVRKKDAYEKKLATLSAEDRKAAVEKIKEIVEKNK